MASFKGRHIPKPVILQCVRWHYAYALSYRYVEEMMAEQLANISSMSLTLSVNR